MTMIKRSALALILLNLLSMPVNAEAISKASTAGAITKHYDGYAAALTNFRFIASKIDNTERTVRDIRNEFDK